MLTLIPREEQGGNEFDQDMKYMAADDADRYASLVAHMALRVQMTQVE